MRCDEVQPLQGLYLDSELDARTTLEVEQHLRTCAGCARSFEEERRQEARLKAGLKQGQRTGELWKQIERSVAAAAVADPRARVGQGWRTQEYPLTLTLSPSEGEGVPFRAGEGRPAGLPTLHVSRGQSFLSALGGQIRAGWRRSRWGWAALAATWVIILGLDFTAREPDTTPVAARGAPSVSEMRLALKQKERLMAELAVTSESAPADKGKAAPPSPRSDWRRGTLNT
jgi:hypothetical protein